MDSIPGYTPYTSSIIAKIKEGSVEFETQVMGDALEQWGYSREDVESLIKTHMRYRALGTPDEITAKLSRLAQYEADEASADLVRLPPKNTKVYAIYRLNNKRRQRKIIQGRPRAVMYGGIIDYLWDYVPNTALLESIHTSRESAEAALQKNQKEGAGQ